MKRWFPPFRYLNVPNLVTSVGIIAGACCLVMLSYGYERIAALCFLATLTADYADGILARRLSQFTELGKELDSFSDLLNFCVLPAIVGWSLGPQRPWLLACLCVYVLAGAWRLAYYNIHGLEEAEGRVVFRGVPTTYMAAVFVVVMCWGRRLGWSLQSISPFFFVGGALLMLSGVPIPKRGPLVPATILVTMGTVVYFVAT